MPGPVRSSGQTSPPSLRRSSASLQATDPQAELDRSGPREREREGDRARTRDLPVPGPPPSPPRGPLPAGVKRTPLVARGRRCAAPSPGRGAALSSTLTASVEGRADRWGRRGRRGRTWLCSTFVPAVSESRLASDAVLPSPRDLPRPRRRSVPRVPFLLSLPARLRVQGWRRGVRPVGKGWRAVQD